ncbi:beta-lactamase family protein [bacterium]|nr:beta-lactamase family protein [bacterium]
MKHTRIILFLLLTLFLSQAEAQPRFLDKSALSSFLDSVAPQAVKDLNVPGAVVIVVQEDQIVFSKGYGVANQESNRPVDPDRTLFRIGSVTKCFTATAILQLIEQGKLQFNDDARKYAEFLKVRHPVTIAQLLTHTGGFEEKLIRTGALTSQGVLPLWEYLKREMPAQVLAPGKYTMYSNHGFVLLGYIVEKVSGKPLGRYLEGNIFCPLKMVQTTYGLPSAESALATGYVLGRAVPQAHLQIGPAAGITSTGSDMARFLIAHLAVANSSDRILSSSMLKLMHQRQFSQHSSLPGLTYGFYESYYNHVYGLYHRGGVRGFASLIYLLPEQRIGIFIANNGDQQEFGFRIVDPFLNKYFPAQPFQMQAASGSPEKNRSIEGTYRFLRYSRNTIEKLALLKRPDILVRIQADGSLDIGGTRFLERGPMLFQQMGSYERAAFLKNDRGSIRYLSYEQDVLEKIPWYVSSGFQQLLFFLFVTAFISTFFRWSTENPHLVESSTSSLAERRTISFAKMLSALNLLFLAGLIAGFMVIKPGRIWLGVPLPFLLLLCLPLLSCCFAAAMPYFVWSAWKEIGMLPRVRLLLLLLINFGFVAYLYFWNLLGFKV